MALGTAEARYVVSAARLLVQSGLSKSCVLARPFYNRSAAAQMVYFGWIVQRAGVEWLAVCLCRVLSGVLLFLSPSALLFAAIERVSVVVGFVL